MFSVLIIIYITSINHASQNCYNIISQNWNLDKPGASLKFVADKFKIAKTTVADIKKQNQSLLADFNNSNLNNKDRKRKREGKHGDIEEALFI